MKLQWCLIFASALFQFSNAVLVFKELRINLYCFAHRRSGSNVQLAHLHGDKVSSVLFAEQLNITQPIILLLRVGEGIINQEIACEIIMQKQFLHGKVIRAGELDNLHIGDLKPVQHRFKLTILVLPKHNAAFIELRQGGRESLVKRKLYRFY